MSTDDQQCEGSGPVDWDSLRDELSAWADWIFTGKRSHPLRWITLCVRARWISLTGEVWPSCALGTPHAILHYAFCSEAGEARAVLFAEATKNVGFRGWQEYVLDSDWPTFEGLAAIKRDLFNRWKLVEREPLVNSVSLPDECEGVSDIRDGGCRVDWTTSDDDMSNCSMDHREVFGAVRLVTDAVRQHEVDIGSLLENFRNACRAAYSVALHLCSSARAQSATPYFLVAIACLVVAAVRPDHARGAIIVAESLVAKCTPALHPIPTLLVTQWPIVEFLSLLHRGARLVVRREKAAITAFNGEITIGNTKLFVQREDDTHPWVEFMCRAVDPEQLYAELPWPSAPAPRWDEVRADALRLARMHQWTGYPARVNHQNSWNNLCLVCQGGTQDPTTVNAESFEKTPLLADTPALEKFIDLFGRTDRVRLSRVSANGGLIGWHPDDGVVEDGRMILHIPLQTSPHAYNRVGNLLFHMPEGHIHWADYSFPHTVFNADPTLDRLHLIIDVRWKDNTVFAKNFLEHLPFGSRQRLIASTRPGSQSAGAKLMRPMAATLTRSFEDFVGSDESRRAEEESWKRIVEAFSH